MELRSGESPHSALGNPPAPCGHREGAIGLTFLPAAPLYIVTASLRTPPFGEEECDTKGEHKAGYRQPRTGEKRAVRQPLKIDKLDEKVRKAILEARADGETWQETAKLPSKAAGESLAVSMVHRWYDLRVDQVQRDVLKQAEQARMLAGAFAGKGVEGLPKVIENALASSIFSMLGGLGGNISRETLVAELFQLGRLVARNRR
jgi:hypothetical protein